MSLRKTGSVGTYSASAAAGRAYSASPEGEALTTVVLRTYPAPQQGAVTHRTLLDYERTQLLVLNPDTLNTESIWNTTPDARANPAYPPTL